MNYFLSTILLFFILAFIYFESKEEGVHSLPIAILFFTLSIFITFCTTTFFYNLN